MAEGATAAIRRALAEFGLEGARTERIPRGLLHASYAVDRGEGAWVLQRVSPVFAPGIHDNIRVVTEHLRARGVPTPRLVPTRRGALVADLGAEGRWRLLTRVPGVSADTCDPPARARAAGALVARFHSALGDLDAELRPLGIALHDTPAHLRELGSALADHPHHPLHRDVSALAVRVHDAARGGEALDALPRRIVHGDLKFSNVLFAAERGTHRDRAVALIDLDTVSRLPLWMDLADAWRSWCNRRGEDCEEAAFDPALHRAAGEGYLGALSLGLKDAERAALLDGLERMCLELAARFAADALRERYFAWDPQRFASRGEHNLVRARGQWSLYTQVREARAARARDLGLAG